MRIGAAYLAEGLPPIYAIVSVLVYISRLTNLHTIVEYEIHGGSVFGQWRICYLETMKILGNYYVTKLINTHAAFT